MAYSILSELIEEYPEIVNDAGYPPVEAPQSPRERGRGAPLVVGARHGQTAPGGGALAAVLGGAARSTGSGMAAFVKGSDIQLTNALYQTRPAPIKEINPSDIGEYEVTS